MSTTIQCKGIASHLNEQTVRSAFIPFGPIKDMQMPVNHNGSNKGIVMIEYEDEMDAIAAVDNMHNSAIVGKTLNVTRTGKITRGKNKNKAIWEEDDTNGDEAMQE